MKHVALVVFGGKNNSANKSNGRVEARVVASPVSVVCKNLLGAQLFLGFMS